MHTKISENAKNPIQNTDEQKSFTFLQKRYKIKQTERSNSMDDIDYIYKEVETRKYRRVNLFTGKTDIVTVTNRNNLPISEHLYLLNLNDPENTYSEIQ